MVVSTISDGRNPKDFVRYAGDPVLLVKHWREEI